MTRRAAAARSLGLPSTRGPSAASDRRGTDMSTTTTAPVAVSAPEQGGPPARADRVDLGDVRVVHTRHWSWWVLSAILIFAIAQFVVAVHERELRVERLRVVLLLRARPDRHRLHACSPRSRHPSASSSETVLALACCRSRRCSTRSPGRTSVLLPLGAARGADHRLVQPRLPHR